MQMLTVPQGLSWLTCMDVARVCSPNFERGWEIFKKHFPLAWGK